MDKDTVGWGEIYLTETLSGKKEEEQNLKLSDVENLCLLNVVHQ